MQCAFRFPSRHIGSRVGAQGCLVLSPIDAILSEPLGNGQVPCDLLLASYQHLCRKDVAPDFLGLFGIQVFSFGCVCLY